MTNKSHDPQAERDRAAHDKEQARAGKAATVDGDRNEVEHAARQGGGPAGLNAGPSDTVSRDPHRPVDGRPIGSDQPSARADGMGQSPPKGAQPTSDKPEGFDPHARRADASGSPEANKAAEANQADRQRMTDAERDADKRLANASGKIADQQGDGVEKDKHKHGK